MATDYGTGFVPPFQFVIKGGPGGWYLDLISATEPEPPASLVKVWDGTAWSSGRVWDGTAWQPLRVWDGTAWVE